MPKSPKPAQSQFGQLPFTWVYEDKPAPATIEAPPQNVAQPAVIEQSRPATDAESESVGQTTPAGKAAKPRVRSSLREAVEKYLRDKGVPYINVDEAKKALFAGAKLRSFHFVVYFPDRRNWLLYTSQLRKESRQDLLQWEEIFGDGFVAVVAKQMTDGTFNFKTLSGDVLPSL